MSQEPAPPSFTLASTVLGTPDPPGLAEFYRALLGWRYREDPAPDWVVIKPADQADSAVGLSFQLEEDHEPPVWPQRSADHRGPVQQMQVHLDIRVDDLDAAVARAVGLGARVAAYQPQDDVRVLLDPAGHPFCLFLPGA